MADTEDCLRQKRPEHDDRSSEMLRHTEGRSSRAEPRPSVEAYSKLLHLTISAAAVPLIRSNSMNLQ